MTLVVDDDMTLVVVFITRRPDAQAIAGRTKGLKWNWENLIEDGWRNSTRRRDMSMHPTQAPEHWERLAKNERAFAAQERQSRSGPVESIRIHEANAAEYQAMADKLCRETSHDHA